METRVFGLDLLRAVAILLVVYGHGFSLVAYRFPSFGVINKLDGVTLFFVLSGYLIGRILIRELGTPLCFRAVSRFWVRRWLRTLPAYFVVMVALIVIVILLEGRAPSAVGPYFLFSQNIAWEHPEFFGEAWSLAVEEWFYLAIPLLLYFFVIAFKAHQKNVIVGLVLSILIGSVIVRVMIVANGEVETLQAWDLQLRKTVVTRLDSLMFGVLGAYISMFHASAWRSWRWPLMGFGLILMTVDMVMIENQKWRDYATLSIAPFATLLLLPLLSSWKTAPHPVFRVFTFVSLISYSLYLVNLELVRLTIIPLFPRSMSTATVYVAYWFFCFAIAYLCWRFVETPFLRLRDRARIFGDGQRRPVSEPIPS